jgi:protein-S-isoprenylcysteine O-methyltransferase Ste14
MTRTLQLLYAVVTYVLFLGVFLYAIGFVGGILVPKTIDTGTPGPVLHAIILDAVLLGIFALQHSIMARPRFKRWWTTIVASGVERTTYVLASNAALVLMYTQWEPIGGSVWQLGGAAASVVWALFWLGWLIVLTSTFMISHFELFGLTQAWAAFRDRATPSPQFRTPLLYGLVRHPIMLGFIIAFWATPTMSYGHLFFAVMTTGYILIALQLEEMDLIGIFGERYRAYRRQVPMLIPLPGRSPRGAVDPLDHS